MKRAILAAAWLGGIAAWLTVGPGPVRAQSIGIEEYQRLIDTREREIVSRSARLDALEARADSLSRSKRTIQAGSAQYAVVSNQILDASSEITTIARRLRTLYEQVRDLKQDLFIARNLAIAETQQQIDDLTNRGRTAENSLEMRRLVDELAAHVRAREQLIVEIEEAQDDLFLPPLPVDPADDPSRLRVKEAIARDAIDRINERVGSIEEQITSALQRQRDLEEFQRLQQDIELWGDRQAAQGGSEIEAILQGRTAGGVEGGAAGLFEETDRRIRELQRRRLELIERREDYEAKAFLFDQRQREFYP